MKQMNYQRLYLINNNSNNFQQQMHHFYRLYPLQSSNLNALGLKPTVTYTDQRIDQIKRKYDTPNKQDQSNKENATNKSMKRCYTEGRERKERQIKSQYNSIGSRLNNRKDEQKNRLRQSGQGQSFKRSAYANVQNLQIKPSITSKLHITQTDQPQLKTEQSIDSVRLMRNKDSYNKINRREYFDPRIESIDKINSKIKRILDCIDDCQKEESRSSLKRSRDDRNQKAKNSFLGTTINFNTDPNQLQQTKIIERQTITYGNKAQPQIIDNSNNKPMHSIPSLTEMRASNTQDHFSQYLNSYKNQLTEKQNESSKAITSQKERSLPKLTSYFEQLKKSFKKDGEVEDNGQPKMDQINQEINKFQQKIVELQQQKRKLNIRFKPFHYQASPIKKLKSSTQHPKYDYSIQQLKNQIAAKQQSIYIEPKPFQAAQSKDIQIAEQGNQSYDNYELRKKIEQRMQQRKKRIQLLDQCNKERELKQTKSLVHALCEQVKLDEGLRNAKNWFSESNNPQRLNHLHQALSKKGINFSHSQIQVEFQQLHQDQSDPFFSFREEKYTIESMVDYYIRCTQHWKDKILHKWNKEKLAQQYFEGNFFNQSDILIEDIVRLLNTQTGSFYRNRDLYLVYRRIKGELKRGYQQIMSINNLIEVFS